MFLFFPLQTLLLMSRDGVSAVNGSESGAINSAVDLPSALFNGPNSSSFQQRPLISIGDPAVMSRMLDFGSGHSSYGSRMEMVWLPFT